MCVPHAPGRVSWLRVLHGHCPDVSSPSSPGGPQLPSSALQGLCCPRLGAFPRPHTVLTHLSCCPSKGPKYILVFRAFLNWIKKSFLITFHFSLTGQAFSSKLRLPKLCYFFSLLLITMLQKGPPFPTCFFSSNLNAQRKPQLSIACLQKLLPLSSWHPLPEPLIPVLIHQ